LTVVITGASSGIGRGLAVRYSKKATNLILISRNSEALLALAKDIQREDLSVSLHSIDITDFEALRELSSRICEEYQKIDIVIANAGISSGHAACLYDFWDFKKVIDTNLLGVAAIFDIFAKKMIESGGGKLVAVSSLASFVASPTSAAYSASKRAINSFLDSLRILLEPKNIKVINIQPGFIKTPLTDKNGFKMPFLMELSPALDRIVWAIEREKKEYAFPFLFSKIVKTISKLPAPLRDAVVKKAVFRAIDR